MAALLAVGHDCHAQPPVGGSARWEILPPTDDPVDVSVSQRPPSSTAPGIRIHRTREPRARCYGAGVGVTTPLRTLARPRVSSVGARDLERAVEEAQVRRLVTRGMSSSRLRGDRTAADEPSSDAVGGGAPAARIDPGREAAAGHETNVRVGRHEVDFLWPEQRVVVEVDGFAFHSTRARRSSAIGPGIARSTRRRLRGAAHARGGSSIDEPDGRGRGARRRPGQAASIRPMTSTRARLRQRLVEVAALRRLHARRAAALARALADQPVARRRPARRRQVAAPRDPDRRPGGRRR